jgi:hypothetical protein
LPEEAGPVQEAELQEEWVAGYQEEWVAGYREEEVAAVPEERVVGHQVEVADAGREEGAGEQTPSHHFCSHPFVEYFSSEVEKTLQV